MNEPKLDEAFTEIKKFIRVNEEFDKASESADAATYSTRLTDRQDADAKLIRASDQVDETAATFRKKFGRNIWPIYYALGFK